MKKFSIVLSLVTCSLIAGAQYKNDNIAFRTLYPQELCDEMTRQKGYLVLDVRSSGEYEDSSSRGMNLGRIKDAVNIDIRELDKRIGEISAYKNKPVFVYCSHSQRSRRAGKMLADSGFTNIININGGMTALRSIPGEACVQNILLQKTPYEYISARSLCKKMENDAGQIIILDVRTDSAFRHITGDARMNAFGHFSNSIHIPLAELEANLGKLPSQKEIIVVDQYGDDAAKAAILLKQREYKKVAVLLEGVDRYLLSNKKELDCKPGMYISPVKYEIINSLELNAFTAANKDYLALDLRTAEEFNNKHKNYWMNIGHINNAVNIPPADLATKISTIEQYRNKPVLVYAFGGTTAVHEAAILLTKEGFTQVKVLAGGLFNLRWTAANIKGQASIAKLVVDVPAENL